LHGIPSVGTTILEKKRRRQQRKKKKKGKEVGDIRSCDNDTKRQERFGQILLMLTKIKAGMTGATTKPTIVVYSPTTTEPTIVDAFLQW
jgi:hypothetical protein